MSASMKEVGTDPSPLSALPLGIVLEGSIFEKTNKITGCQSFETIEVSLNKPLNVEIGNDTSVCGDIELDAGYFGEAAIYKWSNGETSRYINVNISNKYKVTIDQGECSVSDSIEVVVNEILTI